MSLGNREYRIALIIITFLLAFPVIMLAFNGMNSRMLADDFCFAASAQAQGLTGTMNYYYYNWQGTFSSTGVQSVIALIGSGFVGWLPVILIFGWWFGFIYVFWQLCAMLKFSLPRISALALATLILYAVLEGAPAIFQSIYWTSGSVTYALPMMLFTFWCGLVLQLVRATLPTYLTGAAVVVAGISAGLLAGFSPIFAVFEMTVLGLVLIGVWFRHPNHWRLAIVSLMVGLIGAGIGTFVMVIAPGNSVRQALYHKPSGILDLIGINLTSTGSYVGVDIIGFSLVPHLVLLIVGGWIVSHGTITNNKLYQTVKLNSRKWLLLAVGIAFLLLFAIFCLRRTTSQDFHRVAH